MKPAWRFPFNPRRCTKRFTNHHDEFLAEGADIKFSIIEDLSMSVAKAYGMIHPGAADTSAVRATFIIDPEGVLRAMVYYPMSNGRSIPEFLRVIRALKASDKHQIATPEGW